VRGPDRTDEDPIVGHAPPTCRGRPWPAVSPISSGSRFLSFLTGWRIDLAADLLLEPGATVGSVASRVGYGSPYALSTAFTRMRGVSPAQHRAGARVG